MGRIQTNYEEKKQWINVRNTGTVKIKPHCPCLLTRAGGNQLDGDDRLSVIGFSRAEESNGTIEYFDGSLLVDLVVNGPTEIPPSGYGRVTMDWPVIAQCDGERETLEKLSRMPVFPGENGFTAFRSAQSEGWYFRRANACGILAYPEESNAKQGLCWITSGQGWTHTPLRLLSFSGERQEIDGMNLLQISADTQSEESVITFDEDETEFTFHALGAYEMYLTIQLKSNADFDPSAYVPNGELSLHGELDTVPTLSNGLQVQTRSDFNLSEAVFANIKRLSHAGGGYDCANVVLECTGVTTLISFIQAFKLQAHQDFSLNYTLIEREKVATLKLFASWLDQSEVGEMLVEVESLQGYFVFRQALPFV